MTPASNGGIVRQAERIFWVGFAIGLVWGHLLGAAFALWVTS